ncbi:MAG: hypothetical protein D4R76_05380, partial [Methylococcus sp.]
LSCLLARHQHDVFYPFGSSAHSSIKNNGRETARQTLKRIGVSAGRLLTIGNSHHLKAFLPNRQLLGLGMDVFFRYGEIKVLPNFAKESTLTP